jgi:hypothetical protein
MDCPTANDRPAGSRDKWLENLCGEKANLKPIVKQLGASYPGGSCGYARYAVSIGHPKLIFRKAPRGRTPSVARHARGG